MSEVTAVVLNFNGGEDVLTCLESIRASSIGVEIVVVDNASSDGSPDAIAARAPDVRLIRNASNTGFGAGANVGVRAATTPYVVLVNQDSTVSRDAIERLVAALAARPKAGAVGGLVRNPDGSVQPSKRIFPKLWHSALHGTVGTFWPSNPGTRAYLQSERDFAQTSRVDWVSCNSVALRRDVFESVGGFDEQFFFFVEDVDLCRRLVDAGYEIWFEPSAEFSHAWGGSWTSRPLKFLWMHNANLFRYVRKHHRTLPWRLGYPVIAAGVLVRFVLQALRLAVSRRSVPAHRELRP